jgi:hypothetical protein
MENEGDGCLVFGLLLVFGLMLLRNRVSHRHASRSFSRTFDSFTKKV